MKLKTHDGPWRPARSCNANDLFTVREGLQCGNCGALVSCSVNGAENFERAVRNFQPDNCWKHKEKSVWVVFYESVRDAGKPAFFTYKSVEYCKPGRDPWTVDNRKTGEFPTLGAAFAFASKEA